MAKHLKPEEIVAKLRQFEVLTVQGKSIAEAARSIGVSEQRVTSADEPSTAA